MTRKSYFLVAVVKGVQTFQIAQRNVSSILKVCLIQINRNYNIPLNSTPRMLLL